MCKINKPIIDVAATVANIKACRIRAGYSVREIQNIFNFSSPEAIYSWEKGKYIPSIDNLIVIASVYGVTIDQIVITDTVEVEVETDIREVKSA